MTMYDENNRKSMKLWVSRNGLTTQKPTPEDCMSQDEAEALADVIMDVLNPILGFPSKNGEFKW